MKDISIRIIFLSFGLCCTVSAAAAQKRHFPALPQGARILEVRSLSAQGYTQRALVIWMLNPTWSPSDYPEPYTCPEETRGSGYSGPTRVSLIDTARGRVVNTIEIRDPHFDDKDSFDLPYRIRAGYYYHTASRSRRRESRAKILWLRDYNADGRALEFALYDAPFCMGLQTTLIGYEPEKDRVVQYPIRLAVTHNGQTTTETWDWIDYLFSEKPKAPGRWKYEVDYRGRGGTLDSFEIKFDGKARMFQGTLVHSDKQ